MRSWRSRSSTTAKSSPTGEPVVCPSLPPTPQVLSCGKRELLLALEPRPGWVWRVEGEEELGGVSWEGQESSDAMVQLGERGW